MLLIYCDGVSLLPIFRSWKGEFSEPPGTADKLLICACEITSVGCWKKVGVSSGPIFRSWCGEFCDPPGTSCKESICACEASSNGFWNCGPCWPSKSW